MNIRFVFILFFSGLLLSLSPFQDDLAQSIARGDDLYQQYCVQCHLGQGEGVPGVYPPLAGADYFLDDPDKGIRAVKYGLHGPIVVNGKPYKGYMAKPGLDDDEVADVMNYLLHSWGNESEVVVTKEMVASVTKK